MNVIVEGLTFHRRDSGGRIVGIIERLDLFVESGSVHAVIGPNGCGKTSLLKLIAGLEIPSAGSIELTGTQRHDRRTALVFQTPALLPWWNVERNVSTSAEMSGEDKSVLARVRDFYTRRVGLEDFRRSAPRDLSRGMQTKASMARAFAHDADVLLLDEPFVHLDHVSRQRMKAEMETHWQLDPRTHILVTHDIEEAVLMADRVSVMSPAPGRIVDTVTIDISRPRDPDSILEPGFRAAVSRLWEIIASDRRQ